MDNETQNETTMADLKLKIAFSEARDQSDRRYARKVTETVVFGTIILFALAALFFIFTKVGLPTPALP